MLLALPIKEGKLDLLSSLSTIDDKNITIEEKLILKQIDKAAKGDPRAFETLIGIISERSASAAGINESAGSNAGSSFVEALNDKAAEVWNEETTGAV